MARGKTECGLDGEHGRLLETAEMREVDLYIQLVVYRKGGDPSFVTTSSPRVYK